MPFGKARANAPAHGSFAVSIMATLDLRLLTTFFWVIRLGGFRRAAEYLNTTQPAVSSRVTQLEHTIGHRLIDRNRGRGAVPTPMGSQLFEYADRLLRLSDEISAKFLDPALHKGLLRLGVSETISHLWLADLIKGVNRRFPKVAIEVTVDITPRLGEALCEGEIDLAILLGPVEAPEVANLPLCAYPLAFMVPAESWRDHDFEPVEALCKQPLITFPRATRPFQQIKTLLKERGIADVRIFGNSSILSIIRMTLDGIGIGILPPDAVAAGTTDNRLKVIGSDVTLPDLCFTASYLDVPGNALAAEIAKLAQNVVRASGHGSDQLCE